MKTVVFRADASIVMGTGHIMRCLTLADELKRNNFKVIFVSRAHSGNLANSIRSRGYKLVLLPEPAPNFQINPDNVAHATWLNTPWSIDAEETIRAIDNLKPDWLVVDHYGLNALWHGQLRPYVKQILVIDDLADRELDCDILLDQTYKRDKRDYINLVKKDCQMLLGSRFALLRSEFAEYRPSAIKKRKCFDSIKRILVSIGGTDPGNVTATILDSLAPMDWITVPYIDVVMGGQSPHLEEIRELAKNHPLKISISIDVPDMAVRMLQADLAIGAGGSTTWERCCLGLPTLMIMTAENQSRIGECLSETGVIKLIAYQADGKQNNLRKAIEQLIRSKKLWKEMSSKSLIITDGLGAKRTVLELDAPTSSSGLPIRLAPVTLKDSELLYRWQTSPATRLYAHNPVIPTINEHNKWLELQLQRASSFTELIFHGTEPAGLIRLDPVEDAKRLTYLISIYISPDKYKLGIAKITLGIISHFFSFAKLMAEVHKDNLASHALFDSAGFQKTNAELYVKIPDIEVQQFDEY